jgi:hypothetical protein
MDNESQLKLADVNDVSDVLDDQEKKEPSHVIIGSLVNSVMGPGVLLFPLQYFQSGGLLCSSIMILVNNL